MNFISKYLLIFICLQIFFSQFLISGNLYTESFETDGEGVRYNSTTFNDCASTSDYFLRTNDNAPFNTSCAFGNFGDVINNVQGTFFWVSEDVGGAVGNGGAANVTLTSQNIAIGGSGGLSVSVYMGISNDNGTRWELTDSISIQYSKDGGNYITVGRFVGDDAFGGALREDTDLDGVANGGAATMTNTLTQYTYTIPDGGTTLNVRIEIHQNGGSEEFAFDLLEVNASVLPVTLTAFDVERWNKDISLIWETESEINNDKFEIERSNDGANFYTIGEVDGLGNSQTKQGYSFLDKNPHNGMNYYRLKQIDFDGQFSYSDIASMEVNAVEIGKFYPNPSQSGQVQLNYPAQGDRNLNINIYDLSGRLVHRETRFQENEEQILTFDFQLNAGVYFVKLNDGQQQVSRKLVIRR